MTRNLDSFDPVALDNFDRFWTLKSDWFEPPNYRRGGWSGVIQHQLLVENAATPVFIKRQENHLTHSLTHCIKGIPTFQREYQNIQRLRKKKIATLDPVFFSAQKTKAILITKALDDYQSLDTIFPQQLTWSSRCQLLTHIASLIRQLHTHHFQHNCLYPKHIFIRQQDISWDAKLIDLEKLRKRVVKKHAMQRDLSTLSRHLSTDWSSTDRMRFFKAYVGETKLSKKSKKTWRALAKKMKQKRR